MTPEEAIEILDNEYKRIELQIMSLKGTIKENTESFRYRIDVKESLKTAIYALKELQQYREIGTVEECREAVEKQKPKNPDYEGDGYDDKGEMIYDTWICPKCGEKYEVDYDEYEHCPKCGQAIQWENLEEIKL